MKRSFNMSDGAWNDTNHRRSFDELDSELLPTGEDGAWLRRPNVHLANGNGNDRSEDTKQLHRRLSSFKLDQAAFNEKRCRFYTQLGRGSRSSHPTAWLDC